MSAVQHVIQTPQIKKRKIVLDQELQTLYLPVTNAEEVEKVDDLLEESEKHKTLLLKYLKKKTRNAGDVRSAVNAILNSILVGNLLTQEYCFAGSVNKRAFLSTALCSTILDHLRGQFKVEKQSKMVQETLNNEFKNRMYLFFKNKADHVKRKLKFKEKDFSEDEGEEQAGLDNVVSNEEANSTKSPPSNANADSDSAGEEDADD